ncbi:MAG: DUF72 domain-containing protein [Armatimonadota bacterium]
MEIRIGTSGYSYADWKGHFYPRDIKSADMLGYYARRFHTVELNTTYYGIPQPAATEQMTRRVPAGFEFAVKAHRDMTHGGDFRQEVFEEFRQMLAPLREAGMLGCVLAQFPWAFKQTPENRDYLKRLRDELPETPVVVELRNSEWVSEATFEQLRALGLGYCCVDEPRLKGLMPPLAAATSTVGYVRFHGRNAAKWWKHEHAWERYNYLYSAEELQEWVPKIEAVAAQTEKTYVFFNNHYEGKAGVNADQLAALMNLALPEVVETQGALPIQNLPRSVLKRRRLRVDTSMPVRWTCSLRWCRVPAPVLCLPFQLAAPPWEYSRSGARHPQGREALNYLAGRPPATRPPDAGTGLR